MANNRLASMDSTDASISIFVTTNEPNAVEFQVEYTVPGDSSSTVLTLSAIYGETRPVKFPVSLRVAAVADSEFNKGIHVTTVDDKEQITVFGLNDESVSTDGFLALPCRTYAGITAPPVGIGYQYFIFSSDTVDTTEISNLFQSRFIIIPCQDDTFIDVTPSEEIDLTANTFSPTPRLRIPRGDTERLTGQTGQTIMLQSPNDLTGTILVSNKPISVFTGHECGQVPGDMTACDHLVEQIPPHFTWGRTFLTAPLDFRQTGEQYRVGSIYDGTNITVTCTQQETGTVRNFGPTTTDKGEFFEFITLGNPTAQSSPSSSPARAAYRPEFCCIQASEIVSVMGYARAHEIDEIPGSGGAQGDPFMILIPPVTQYLNNYTITTAKAIQLFSGHISTVLPAQFFSNSAQDQANVLFDGDMFQPIPFHTQLPQNFDPNNAYHPINCTDNDKNDAVCGYAAYSEITGTSEHTIVYDGGPGSSMNVYVYGFLTEISYAYPAGMEMQPIGRKLRLCIQLYIFNSHPVPRVSCCEENTIVEEDRGNFTLCIRKSGNMQFGVRAQYNVSAESTAIGTYRLFCSAQ